MPETADYSSYGHPKGHTDANGNWVRNTDSPLPASASGPAVDLRIPISYVLADAAVLLTVSEQIFVTDMYYEITKPFTGGTSAAIGVSSDTAPHDTKGDLLGGASGDKSDMLVISQRTGTKGSSFATPPVTLDAGAVVRFDRIASAFTAGEGYLRIIGQQAT